MSLHNKVIIKAQVILLHAIVSENHFVFAIQRRKASQSNPRTMDDEDSRSLHECQLLVQAAAAAAAAALS